MLEKYSNQFVISKTSNTTDSKLVSQPHNNFANLDWRSPPLFWNDWSLAFESKKMPQAQGAPAPVFFLPLSYTPPLSKLPNPLPHLLLLPSLLCLSSFFAPPALSQQFTSSVSQTVTFAFCPGARKRAPRCHHALCFVCSYFKSHNSHNLLSLFCVCPVFVFFLVSNVFTCFDLITCFHDVFMFGCFFSWKIFFRLFRPPWQMCLMMAIVE